MSYFLGYGHLPLRVRLLVAFIAGVLLVGTYRVVELVVGWALRAMGMAEGNVPQVVGATAAIILVGGLAVWLASRGRGRR